MLKSSPEAHRKELDFLSDRLRAVKDEARKRAVSDAQHILNSVQNERDRLAAKLSDIEEGRTSWGHIRAEFEGAWNKFVTDLVQLESRMQEIESTNQSKP
jgi:hypothetical protein